jgi:predicted  nucleic acid-binding Zn-ribbon protein
LPAEGEDNGILIEGLKKEVQALNRRCDALEKTIEDLKSRCDTHMNTLESHRKELLRLRRATGTLDASYQEEHFEVMG